MSTSICLVGGMRFGEGGWGLLLRAGAHQVQMAGDPW